MHYANEVPAIYYHAAIGDVDIKVKIVAVGCPSEAVTVQCARRGYYVFDGETELQSREILSRIKQAFPSGEYKVIPIPTAQSIGMKIHTVRGFSLVPGETPPAPETMDIFERVCSMILEWTGESMGRGRFTEQALKREVARIISHGGHLGTKVDDIVGLLGKVTA